MELTLFNLLKAKIKVFLVYDGVLSRLHKVGGMADRFGFRMALSECESMAADVRTLSDHLPEAARELERQFLDFQAILEKLAAVSSDFLSHGQIVVKMATGQETGDLSFQRILDLLEAPLLYLDDVQLKLEGVVEELQGGTGILSQLLETEEELKKTSARLQINQVMLRIRSAALTNDQRQAFLAVTEEIDRLKFQIETGFESHRKLLTELHAGLVMVLHDLRKQISGQGKLVAAKKKLLGVFLADLTEQMINNLGRNVELTTAGKDLSNAVFKAVFSLQVQDALSQKLDHARQGLIAALDAFEVCRSTASDNRTEPLGRALALSRIEVAQLKAALTELYDTEKSLQGTFAGITAQLEQLGNDCLALKEFSDITASASGTVQGLLESLVDLRDMVGRSTSITARAEKSLMPIQAVTGQLTDTLQAVAHEMHLLSLNAQIQAITLGDESGLEILAANISDLSQETTLLSSQVSSQVKTIATGAANQSQILHKLRLDGERHLKTLSTQGAAEESALHAFRDATLREVGVTGDALDQARHLGGGILNLLDFKNATQKIVSVQELVRNLQDGLHRIVNLFEVDLRSINLADIHGRYTMASERQIHAEALGDLFSLSNSVETRTPRAEHPSEPDPFEDFSAPTQTVFPSASVDLFEDFSAPNPAPGPILFEDFSLSSAALSKAGETATIGEAGAVIPPGGFEDLSLSTPDPKTPPVTTNGQLEGVEFF